MREGGGAMYTHSEEGIYFPYRTRTKSGKTFKHIKLEVMQPKNKKQISTFST